MYDLNFESNDTWGNTETVIRICLRNDYDASADMEDEIVKEMKKYFAKIYTRMVPCKIMGDVLNKEIKDYYLKHPRGNNLNN